jgi:hypothetical protein
LFWINVLPHIAKGSRYTIGTRIENKFLDLLELSYVAYFTPLESKPQLNNIQNKLNQSDFLTGFAEKEKKLEKITNCILITDTLKFLISIAWEGKLISNKQYEDIGIKLEEIGKMLGGWKKSLSNPEKKNRAF